MVQKLPTADVIRKDAHGDLRVGETNVLLDMVVYAFRYGATCEEIVLRFSSLSLADACGAVAFPLKNRDFVEEYISKREQKGDKVQRRIEALQTPLSEVRARIFARQAAKLAVGSDGSTR